MSLRNYLFLCMVLLFVLACTNEPAPSSESEAAPKANYEFDNSISLPEGFKAAVVADSVGNARHISVRDNGDIYIQLYRLRDEKGVVALRDTNGDARADIISYFGNHFGTGSAIYNDHLYVSSRTEVFRYAFNDNRLVPDESSKTLIAGGFPDQRSHAAKSLAFDQEGNMYVNVGGPSNACMEEARTAGSKGVDPCPQLERQASIWRFKADQPAQLQTKDGFKYASGIRNAVAIEWNTTTNNLFALQHGRDQLHQFWPDLYTEEQGVEMPAEEFLSIQEGDFFGWPYCYFDPFQDKKLLAPEYGGDGKTAGRCADAKDPILDFPAHMAPNDLIFYQGDQFPERYRNGAFIAFHGSWNRSPQEQKGYFIVFVPMQDGQPSGDWEVFADGFSGPGPIEGPRDAIYRPCGLAVGPDGSLYITDDVKGKVWRVVYEG